MGNTWSSSIVKVYTIYRSLLYRSEENTFSVKLNQTSVRPPFDEYRMYCTNQSDFITLLWPCHFLTACPSQSCHLLETHLWVFSILPRIEWKYHRIHLTQSMRQHETCAHYTLCLSQTLTCTCANLKQEEDEVWLIGQIAHNAFFIGTLLSAHS